MKDQKNIQVTTVGVGSKEAAFAEMMQKKNYIWKQNYYIGFFVYLLWTLVINMVLDYQLQDRGDQLVCILMLLGMFLWLCLFSENYFKCYFTLLGENGEQEQNIMTVVRQFPFSLTAYSAYIKRQLRFWQGIIFGGTMAISALGMLIFFRHDYYPVFLWETQDSEKDLLLRILGILLISLFMAMLPVWSLQIKLAMVHKYHRNDGRYLRKKGNENPRKMKQEKKWLLICMEILLVIFLCVFFMVIEGWIHPFLQDDILFIHTPNLWIFSVVILMDAVRTFYQYLMSSSGDMMQYQERIRQWRKIAIQLCVGLLVFIVPQFYYETYYEDRMEGRYFIQTKNYEWKDVLSYEVYCPVFGEDIQLRLYMKDGSKKKVLWNHTNYSEKYYSDYDSDYVYIEKMVEKLEALGAEGSLKDSAKISRKIDREQDDPNDWEAWKNIQKMVQDKAKD